MQVRVRTTFTEEERATFKSEISFLKFKTKLEDQLTDHLKDYAINEYSLMYNDDENSEHQVIRFKDEDDVTVARDVKIIVERDKPKLAPEVPNIINLDEAIKDISKAAKKVIKTSSKIKTETTIKVKKEPKIKEVKPRKKKESDNGTV